MSKQEPLTEREESLYLIIGEMRKTAKAYLDAQCALALLSQRTFGSSAIDRELERRMDDFVKMAESCR
jgi:hypothetical protein